MRRCYRVGVIGFVAALGLSSLAGATSSAVELEYVERELVLPEGVMRFDAGPRWPYYDSQLKHVVIPGDDLDFLNPGLTFGIVDDLELGFVAPLRLSPDFDIEDPRVHVLYQFHRGQVDAGIFGELRLGLFDQWRLTGGVPVQWDLSRSVRLDTGGFLQIIFGDGSTMNLLFPAQLPVQLSSRLYLGPEFGVNFNNAFDEGSNVSLPFGGFVGYSIGSGGATLGDLYARLRLEDLAEGFDVVSVMLGTELYFDM